MAFRLLDLKMISTRYKLNIKKSVPASLLSSGSKPLVLTIFAPSCRYTIRIARHFFRHTYRNRITNNTYHIISIKSIVIE